MFIFLCKDLCADSWNGQFYHVKFYRDYKVNNFFFFTETIFFFFKKIIKKVHIHESKTLKKKNKKNHIVTFI